MFYSVLIVYSYLCYVELSRGTDLEALFYGVLTMLYSVSFVYSYPCYAELSGGTDLQAFKKKKKKKIFLPRFIPLYLYTLTFLTLNGLIVSYLLWNSNDRKSELSINFSCIYNEQ